MPTITDAMTAATQAVTDNATAYQTAAAAVNAEIATMASNSGQNPTANVGSRFTRAARSGQLTYVADTSTTPGVITVAPALAHTAYIAGLPLCIRLNQSISGPTILSLSGLPNIPVRYLGGGELQKFDFLAGDLIDVECDGSALTFIATTPPSRLVIDTAVTKTVHGLGADFADLIAAMAWVNRRRISATGSVTFQVAAGVNANRFVYTQTLNLAHPDGARITITGQPLNASPIAGSSLSFTGSTAGPRGVDTGVNLGLLRTLYQTELFFQGCGVRGTGQIGNIADLLLTSDGNGGDLVQWQSGFVTWTSMAVVGAGGAGINTGAASFAMTGYNYVLGCAGNGIFLGAGGSAVLAGSAWLIANSNGGQGLSGYAGLFASISGAGANLYARGNGTDGVAIVGGRCAASALSISTNNGGSGFASSGGRMEAAGSTSSNNGAHGYTVSGCGYIDATSTQGSGNTSYGYLAADGANLRRPGGTGAGNVAVASPAIGSTGNNNAYIS